jgi:polar amino acid transport system permease protein
MTGNYTWGWFTVSPFAEGGRSNLLFLLNGLIPTILVSIVSITISVSIGIIITLAAISRFKILRTLNRFWVEIFRSVPVLVMLLWTYYGLPVSLGINMNVFAAAVVALSLCDSAFESEIFRAGFQSIPKSQYEAARLDGAGEFRLLFSIIMPQAVKNILPPLVNQFAFMLKMSSIASVIGLGELTRKANELTVIEYRPLEIYTLLVAEYLILVLVVSFFARKLEKVLAANAVE